MDTVSLAATMSMAKSMSRAQVIAAKIIKDNAQSEQSVANLLEASTQNLQAIASEAPHLGTNLDVTV